jgi:hypothetical protein
MSSINAGTGIVYNNDGSGTLDLQGGGSSGISVNSAAPYVKTVANTTAISGTSGMLVYNTAVNGLSGYTNGFWETITLTPPGTQRAIFGYGTNTSGSVVSMTNLVSNTGVVGTDVTGVGTARSNLAAATYGGDKAIFGYGFNGTAGTNVTNLVSSTGVVATDTAGVGNSRFNLAAASYGTTGQALFGFGSGLTSVTNLVSSAGVVSTDTTGVGTARQGLAATSFGTTGQAIFAYGNSGSPTAISNQVSNTGVVSTDTTGVGTARQSLAATRFGTTGQAIFGFGDTNGSGSNAAMTNLVSNTGVVATDTTGVGTARRSLAAAGFGTTGQAIFGYGQTSNTAGTNTAITNLVSSTGVVATDTAGVGTARSAPAAAAYSST